MIRIIHNFTSVSEEDIRYKIFDEKSQLCISCGGIWSQGLNSQKYFIY